MKRFIILLLAIIPLLNSCKKEEASNNQYQEIAWNSLSAYEKSTVIGKWQDATTIETTFNNKKAILVTFQTTNNALLGPITITIDAESKIIVDKGIRD